jgi:hypothetical protein
MIAQGLAMICAGCCASFGVLTFLISPEGTKPDGPSPGEFIGAFALETLVHLAPGVLLLWSATAMAGWSRRSRKLGLVALSSSLASLIGCTCSFTAIAMCVWGWLVLTDDDVVRDFDA